MSPSSAGSESLGSSSVFSGVFIAAEVGGVGDKGVRRYYNSRWTDTLGGLLKHVPEICLFD
jgi:hypothetical protein